MELRHDAWHDPACRAALITLFDRVWPRLAGRERHAAALGFPWSTISTSTVVWDGGRVLAHAGLLELPMHLGGTAVRVGGIHAVCTDPDHRRKGLAAQVLARAVAFGAERHPLLMLGTDVPDVYRPWGFRDVQSHQFVLDRAGPGGGEGWRRIVHSADPDIAHWLRLLATRVPLSDQVSFCDRGPVNVFDMVGPDGGCGPLYYCAALDVVTYAESVGEDLVVHDIVAAGPFDVDALLAGSPFPHRRIRFNLNVDRLNLPVRVEPRVYDGMWMVRGPFIGDHTAWALPPYSEC